VPDVRTDDNSGASPVDLRVSLHVLTRRIRTILDELEIAAPIAGGAPPDRVAECAHKIQRLRAKRQSIFGDALFGEPAWDMLLDLSVSESKGRAESVTSVCLASHVPQTTALRWLVALENGGWVSRRPDPCDRRRTLVVLTEKARAAMDRFFAQPELEIGGFT
jgi:DNA-binding MarR family transcriptional regulator